MPLGVKERQPQPFGRECVGPRRGSFTPLMSFKTINFYEAQDVARAVYRQSIQEEVRDLLDDGLPESTAELVLVLYMIGYSEDRAKPTITFVSRDKVVRKSAFNIVKNSNILQKYPGFQVANIPEISEFELFRRVGGVDGMTGDATPSRSLDPPTVLFTAKEGIYRVRHLIAYHGQGHDKVARYSAAGGIVTFGGHKLFLTANHILDPPDLAPEHRETGREGDCNDDRDDDIEITGLSDDEDENFEVSHQDFIKVMSWGSQTSEGSSIPDTDPDMSVSDASSANAFDTLPPSIGQSDETTSFAIPEKTPSLTEVVEVGQVVWSSTEHDALLVEINPKMTAKMKISDRDTTPLDTTSTFGVEYELKDATVVCAAPDGDIRGRLIGTPSLFRPPGAKKFEEVYLVRFDCPLVGGECGSWVRDATTGRLVGHAIAASLKSGLTMVMPACRVFPKAVEALLSGSGPRLLPSRSGTGHMISTLTPGGPFGIDLRKRAMDLAMSAAERRRWHSPSKGNPGKPSPIVHLITPESYDRNGSSLGESGRSIASSGASAWSGSSTLGSVSSGISTTRSAVSDASSWMTTSSAGVRHRAADLPEFPSLAAEGKNEIRPLLGSSDFTAPTRLLRCPWCLEQNYIYSTPSLTRFKRHFFYCHGPSSNEEWTCPVDDCWRVFEWEGAFSIHMEDVHPTIKPRRLRILLCSRIVFACGVKGCDTVLEAVDEQDSVEVGSKYFDHVAAHFLAEITPPEWSYSTRFRNLLRQSWLGGRTELESDVSWLLSSWFPGSSYKLKKKLETRHFGVDREEFIKQALSAGPEAASMPLESGKPGLPPQSSQRSPPYDIEPFLDREYGTVQIGDIIKLGQLGWRVYNFGWSTELKASDQYNSLGAEVKNLTEHLDILTEVVDRAQRSLQDGVPSPAPTTRPRWHLDSLLDIVGDYGSTLDECHRLIEANNRFRETTGAVRNIEWNALVLPSVDRLRSRILLHNSRIQNVLKPFEIDLLVRVHEDISQRITAVHDEVRGVGQDLRSLIGILVPSLAEALELRSRRQIHTISFPDGVIAEFEAVFNLHPSCIAGRSPPLRDMADSFIASYERSTILFSPGLMVDQRIPPTLEYLSLLKCQFLLMKLRVSDELCNASALSHWRGYVDALEEKLSDECYRFLREMAVPDISNRTDDMLRLWPEEHPVQVFDTVTARLMFEDLMEASLHSESNSHRKTLKLLRHIGSRDRRYRLVITVQAIGQQQPQRQIIDFDITSTVLNPVYALPSSQNGPLEMVLEENHNFHRLVFARFAELLKFQQALTGFLVVDNYAEYMTKVSFTVEGQRSPLIVDASLQLWIPRRLEGRLVTDDSSMVAPAIDTSSGHSRASTPSLRGDSEVSMISTNGGLNTPRNVSAMGTWNRVRTNSSQSNPRSPVTPPPRRDPTMSAIFRQQSLVQIRPGTPEPILHNESFPNRTPAGLQRSNSTLTSAFQPLSPRRSSSVTGNTTASSSNSDHTIPVSIANSTGTGVIHIRPLNPTLILFTRYAGTGRHSLVSISINDDTFPNADRCKCRQRPLECRITALEQNGGRQRLDVRRLDERWDVLPLAVLRRTEADGFGGAEWRGVTRVSILFQSPDFRFSFGGSFCECRNRTEGEEIECLKQGHGGLLGQVRVVSRRQMTGWHERRYESHVEVVRRSPGNGLVLGLAD